MIPEDDEILYSTLCEAVSDYDYLRTSAKWRTYILITKTGIAYTDNQKKLNFYYWNKMRNLPHTQFNKKKIYFNKIWFKVIRDEDHESKEVFKSRATQFGSLCRGFFEASRPEYNALFIKEHSKFYVPVDFSNLSLLISKYDHILYSTFCHIDYKHGNSLTYWESHVLITKFGIAYADESGKDHFRYWNTLNLKFSGYKINLDGRWLKVIYHPIYESQNTFLKREWKFGEFCERLRNNFNVHIKEMINYADNPNVKISIDSFNDFLEKIFSFLKAGYYQTSLIILDKVLHIVPQQNKHQIWFFKGEAFRLFNKKEDAIYCYDMALKLEPNYLEAENERKELVSKMLDSISDRNKKKAINLYLKGEEEYKGKNYEDALIYYDKALKLNPYDAPTLNSKGITLEALGKIKEAIKCYDGFLRVYPYNSKAFKNKERCLELLQNSRKEMYCEQCGSFEPVKSESCSNCGKKFD